jgi:hypothetical protein
MRDAATVLSILTALAALAIAIRSDRRSARTFAIQEIEHEQRQAEREATPELAVSVEPANFPAGDDGVIRVDASAAHVRLTITVTNAGSRGAGRTLVTVWMPRNVGDSYVKWVAESGHDIDATERASPDDALKLPTGDGGEFDTQKITRTLGDVDRVGHALHLLVPCGIPLTGEARYPIHVLVRAADSRAEADYSLRLARAQAHP